MNIIKSYKLVEDEKNGDGYVLVINLRDDNTEFSGEFLTGIKQNIEKIDDTINRLVQENFSNVKVNSIKLMTGALLVAVIPFAASPTVKAADTVTTQQAAVQYSNIIYLNTTGTVLATKLNVRSGPSANNIIVSAIYQGNSVKVLGQVDNWYKVQLYNGTIGWVSASYLQVGNRQQKIDTVVNAAKSVLGTPYVWGGESLSEGGFDCSGLAQYVYKQIGYGLNRVSYDQSKQGIYVGREYLQSGDLVFFSFDMNGVVNHVGIYIGNGKMIHSPKAGDVVKSVDITTSYWQSRLVCARRIVL